MSRFRTNDQIRAEAAAREHAEQSWDAEERRRADLRQRELEERQRQESLFRPLLDDLVPIVLPLWQEYATARELADPSIKRAGTGLDLMAKTNRGMGNSLEYVLGLYPLKSGELVLKESIRFADDFRLDGYSMEDPRDFAHALAEATGKEVHLTAFVEKGEQVIQVEKPQHKNDGD